MNPYVIFWIPAALRLALIWIGAGVLWFYYGPMVGLLAALIAMTAIATMQLHYLYRLNIWLDVPDSEKLPDGWGAWNAVFARLYKLHREEEKSRAELNEWLARFKQAMNFLPDGVAILDNVLFLEWCNPIAERHLGLTLERDKGMRVTNLIRHPDFINYIILGRYDQPLTVTLRDRRIIVQIIPFENRRQILVTHDATDAERIDTMRRDFIANASHELRTPLTVINGFLEIEMTQPDLDPATRKDHMRMMREQGERMQMLVEDMLSLTKLESTDFSLRAERVNIAALLEQVQQEALALSGGKHNITLSVDGPDITGSIEELHAAFGNIVSNAVRYTPENGEITLRWKDTGSGPRFSVQDTGIGIAPEHISRLTERFYRVDKGRSRETRGTGLGLSIVRHVLLRHKGSLEIESQLGKGSMFTVIFPSTIIAE
ncbi:MAG: phosphate regulon sensor histidine kinase PhoR [Oxalobacter sp.]|nr:MAG: phosphate regulon sensor histidine kinase PhoR [Oxalobacter sp.]